MFNYTPFVNILSYEFKVTKNKEIYAYLIYFYLKSV